MSQANTAAPAQGAWWTHLTSYHWFVFVMAALAWMFDCFDQQIFILFRDDALKSLMPDIEASVVKQYGGYATAIFVAGWATGGLIFGSVGDRIGRAKTLTITVLLYSLFTGLSALSSSWWDFAVYRFITGLGVGGVFGLAVALIADTLPDRARPGALGMLQALSAVGNISAGLVSMAIARMIASGSPEWISSTNAWRAAFLIGSIPAFLCVFIQMRLKEPEKWIQARDAGRLSGNKLGSYTELLGARWRKPALLGMMICISGVVGLWGLGFFSPELVGDVITTSSKATLRSEILTEQGMSAEEIANTKSLALDEVLKSRGLNEGEVKTIVDATNKKISSLVAHYRGLNGIIQNAGAFFGMVVMAYLAQWWGRKPAFLFAFVGAFLATNLYFTNFKSVDQMWMTAIMGFFQLALFAGYAIYLPELFPTRLRSTGTSFCYNVGRFIAATGPYTFGELQKYLSEAAIKSLPEAATAAEQAAAKLEAFRDATFWVSLVFIVGLLTVFILPETKGKPLPED